MPQNYQRSTVSETITILRTWTTTITIQAFGSGDGFTTPGTEFGDDEEVMVSGAVKAGDNANLTGVNIEIRVDGVFAGVTPLYGFDGVNNLYQASLGILAVGTHVIEATFPRTRR